jgi:dipeptidyl aminopeptidase/acylaminoacyl peptidase
MWFFSSRKKRCAKPVRRPVGFRPQLEVLESRCLPSITIHGASVLGTGVTPTQSAAFRYVGTPAVSTDGRYVVFDSPADNLVPGDTNQHTDVFRRDLLTGEITLVSATPSGTSGDHDSSNPVMSADGRFVAFLSSTDNLGPGSIDNVLLRDLNTGVTYELAQRIMFQNDVGLPLAISPDGRLIAFTSLNEVFVCSVTPMLDGSVAVGNPTPLSAATDGTSRESFQPAIAGSNGSYVVVFESNADDLVSNDTDGALDVFARPVTVGASGQVTLGATTVLSINGSGMAGGGGDYSQLAIGWSAGQGYTVAFLSDAPLDPRDTNGTTDVYAARLSADGSLAGTFLVSVNADGTASGDANSGYTVGFDTTLALSPDGHYLAFSSKADNLVGGDSNGKQDIFVRDVWQGAAGTTVLVSSTSAGQSANDDSWSPAIGGSNGSYFVSFDSAATDLFPGGGGATNGDVFGRTLSSTGLGAMTLVSVGSDGSGDNSDGYPSVVSADGGTVVFGGVTDRMVPGATTGGLFARNVGSPSPTTVLVDRRDPGLPNLMLNGDSFATSVSADGSRVLFISNAPNRDGSNEKLYVHDFRTGETSLVSGLIATSFATDPNGGVPLISADGRYVAFGDGSALYLRDLDAGTTRKIMDNNSSQPLALSPHGDYVVDSLNGALIDTRTGNVVRPGFYYATSHSFSEDEHFFVYYNHLLDLTTGQDTVLGNGFDATISADGRWVVFAGPGGSGLFAYDTSQRNTPGYTATQIATGNFILGGDPIVAGRAGTYNVLVPMLNQGVAVYNLGTGATFTDPNASTFFDPFTTHPDQLSADGRYLAYGSDDGYGSMTAYVEDLQTVTTVALAEHLPEVLRIPGLDPGSFIAPSLSGDGNTLAFSSHDSTLVPGDFNNSWDAFAAVLRSAGVQGPASGVAGQSLSFTLNAADAFQTAPNSQFMFVINWGDGSTQTVTGPSGATATHVYAADGSYTVQLSYTDEAGRTSNTASQAVTINPMTAVNLEQVLSSGGTVTIQTTSADQAHAVFAAANGLDPISTPPCNIILDLGGQTVQDTVANVPSQVTLTMMNGTFIGGSPALTIQSGQVIVLNSIFTNSTDAPTMLVTGGSLKLRNDTVQESTGFKDSAISITGGTVDLGTAGDLGGNIINVNGAGTFIQNTTANPVTAVGDGFERNGQLTAWPAPLTMITNSSVMLVGNSPPSLTGAVSGTPFTGSIGYTTAYGDQVTVTLSTAASGASPVGQYPIIANLSGGYRDNYIIDPASSHIGTMYVVSLGVDPSSTTGAEAVVFWDNKGNAKLITVADLSSLDVLNLVTQGGSAFDPKAVAQLQAWLSVSPNATTSYQLAVQLAVMDLNTLAGYVQTTDLVYAGALLPYAGTYGITGLTSGGFISVQNLMNSANSILALDPRAVGGDPNQAFEAALAQVFQSANLNSDFVQQELLWNLVGLYPTLV